MDNHLTTHHSHKIPAKTVGTRGRAVLSVLVAVLALSGCATTALTNKLPDVSVSDARNGQVEASTQLRWGGTIVAVENRKDLTLVEIVSRPLGRTGRPHHNDQTDGRFFAEFTGFIDPQIASIGRDMTIIGEMTRVDDGKVGEAAYQFPVVTVTDYQFWQTAAELTEQNAYLDQYHYAPYSYGYGYGYGRGNGHRFGYGHSHGFGGRYYSRGLIWRGVFRY